MSKKGWFYVVCLVGLLSLAALGCASQGGTTSNTAKGAGIGTASGAALGAVIGSTQGEMGKGAVIGGLAGAAIGTAVGYNMDKQAEELAQVPNTTVEQKEDRVVVTMDSAILFAVNSSTLVPGSQETINGIADVMVKYPESRIIVKGHTDSTGSEQYNQDLSERRATVVKNYLIGKGVAQASITAIGFGESVPVASNDTEEGRARNRRVELEVRPPQQ